MQIKVENWLRTEHGSWVRYSVAGVQVVMELIIAGLRFDATREVRLSNAPMPPRGECTVLELASRDHCEPVNPGLMEVRFSRRHRSTAAGGMCASVLPGFGSTVVMYANTLAIRQDPPCHACPIDIFLWIPNGEYAGGCSVSIPVVSVELWLVAEPRACVMRGSTVALLSGEGQVIDTLTCISPGYLDAMPSPPSPPYIRPVFSTPPFPVVVFFVPVCVLAFVRLGICVVERARYRRVFSLSSN